MDFESLKQSSSNFDAITKNLETKLSPEDRQTKTNIKMTGCGNLELDKTGNGYAVIRFLPASNGEDMRGKECGHMHSKIKVVGILRTH